MTQLDLSALQTIISNPRRPSINQPSAISVPTARFQDGNAFNCRINLTSGSKASADRQTFPFPLSLNPLFISIPCGCLKFDLISCAMTRHLISAPIIRQMEARSICLQSPDDASKEPLVFCYMMPNIKISMDFDETSLLQMPSYLHLSSISSVKSVLALLIVFRPLAGVWLSAIACQHGERER